MLDVADAVPDPARRSFLATAVGGALVGLLGACAVRGDERGRSGGDSGAGVLSARPADPAEQFPGPGTHALGLDPERDALLHVPAGIQQDRAAPLVVSLHGAGGDAWAGVALLQGQGDGRGLLLLAPASRGSTWDAVGGGYGPDLRLIDLALEQVFRTVAVDPERIAVAGFSDGASYALGLGLANGALFSRIVAFSPGFVPPGRRSGDPAVFISHGTGDEVLPIDRTSRRIVPVLRDEGLDVTYREFPGPHLVPPEIAEEGMSWLASDASG
ncbi:alpha/beta hydrolase [Naasia sp. SYSU D00948]|uniref:alpha/beta hydrolase n=1 Tax=Naasia sp. SYSU D00948 TaxID=2817379 RepID=UPI001B30AE41|nr:hypothetical protein [Naasia sp. SYSU D00948]